MSYLTTASLGKSSKKQFNGCLTKWLAHANKPLNELIADPDASLSVLRLIPIKQTNVNLHLYFSAIIAYITYEGSEADKKCLPQWVAIQKENSKSMTEHYTKNEPTEIQKGVELKLDEVVALRDSLPPGIDKLLLGFYTYIPAMRADYYATRILAVEELEPADENYIKEGVLVVQDYKTKKKYGAIRTPIPEPLLTQLTDSLKLTPRNYLFIKRGSKDPMSRNEYSGWANRILSRLFNKRTTLTALRHSVSTATWTGVDISSLKERSESMGHSVSMSMAYVWK